MPIITNLVAYWSLDEGSGNAIDAHSTFDLTDNATVTTTAGKVVTARDFDSANSEFFSHADDAAFSRGDTDFSFAAWVFIDSLTGTRGIITKSDGTTNKEYLLHANSDPSITWGASSNGSTTAVATWGSVPTTGVWYFIVVWHDAANDLIGISVNADTPVTAAHASGIFNGGAPFNLGALNSTTNFFDGRVDEVGLWSKVLSSEERTWLYNSGNGRGYADIVAEGESAPFFTTLSAQYI